MSLALMSPPFKVPPITWPSLSPTNYQNQFIFSSSVVKGIKMENSDCGTYFVIGRKFLNFSLGTGISCFMTGTEAGVKLYSCGISKLVS